MGSLFHSPFQTIHGCQYRRLCWVVMLATTLFLEGSALFFQYVMALEPCEMCVYQRLAVVGLSITALWIMMAPSNPFVRVTGYGLWVVSGLYGLKAAMAQTGAYAVFGTPAQSCNFLPTFPFDIPLHNWFPAWFMPTGFCGADEWSFLGMNMAQWMVIAFAIYLVAAAVCMISSLWCGIAITKNSKN